MTGLEPATLGVTGRYSNQLSYTRALRCSAPLGAAHLVEHLIPVNAFSGAFLADIRCLVQRAEIYPEFTYWGDHDHRNCVGQNGGFAMLQTAFLAISLAMLGGGALAAKSAIDIQHSVTAELPAD